MKPVIKNLLLWVAAPMAVGILAEIPIVNSENGYVAGFIFLPLFVLVILASFGLFIGGLIATGLKGRPGLWVVLSSIMLFGGFMGMATIAKEFEIGAYREEPMVRFPADKTNAVLFKPGTTNQQINEFLVQTISSPHPGGGTWPLPGIQTMGNMGQHNGLDVVSFDFFESATEEQRQEVYARVRSSPYVFELKENVSSKDFIPKEEPLPKNQSQDSKKAVVIDSATPSQ